MTRWKSTITLLAIALLAAPAARAGIPDFGLSTATTAAPAEVSVCNRPDGQGARLDACCLYGGATADATITLTLVDGMGVPIYSFPFEDLWLETADGDLAACPGGTCANSNTDIQGRTWWRWPLFAGGSGIGTVVMLSGMALAQPPLPIRHNSPDVNGDRVVNLVDLALYSADSGQGYAYRSDFHWDGDLDLSDLTILAQAWGASCP